MVAIEEGPAGIRSALNAMNMSCMRRGLSCGSMSSHVAAALSIARSS